MTSFEYDPTATYPNVGERGCSSIQTVKMRLDMLKDADQKYMPGMRYQITVALPRAQVEMLMLQDPEAFDNVKPIPAEGAV
jgi:hypothetical protein